MSHQSTALPSEGAPETSGGLCWKCRGKLYTCVIDECRSCGATTSNGGFKLCPECAARQNKCAFCGGQLDAVKPPTPPDARIVHLVGLLDPDRSKPTDPPPDRAQLIAETGAAVDNFRSLVAERYQNAVEIVNEMRAIGMVVVRCTIATAEELKQLPEVHLITEDQ